MGWLSKIVTFRIRALPLIGGCAALLFIALVVGLYQSGWIESHPGTAAWVQAVGTVTAVVVAMFAPAITAWFSRREARAARDERTQVLIESLVMPTISVGTRAIAIKLELANRRNGPPPEQDVEKWMDETILLRLPVELEFLHQRLEGIDPHKTAPYRDVVRAVIAYNSVRSQFSALGRKVIDIDWSYLLRVLNEEIDTVRRKVDASQGVPWV